MIGGESDKKKEGRADENNKAKGALLKCVRAPAPGINIDFSGGRARKNERVERLSRSLLRDTRARTLVYSILRDNHSTFVFIKVCSEKQKKKTKQIVCYAKLLLERQVATTTGRGGDGIITHF